MKKFIFRIVNALIFILLFVVIIKIVQGIRINPTLAEFSSILGTFFLIAVSIKLDDYLYYKNK